MFDRLVTDLISPASVNLLDLARTHFALLSVEEQDGRKLPPSDIGARLRGERDENNSRNVWTSKE